MSEIQRTSQSAQLGLPDGNPLDIEELLKRAFALITSEISKDRINQTHEFQNQIGDALAFLKVQCLLWAASFRVDTNVSHPDISNNYVFRFLGTLFSEVAADCIKEAKKLEGSDLNPVRFGVINFEIATRINECSHERVAEKLLFLTKNEVIQYAEELNASKP